MTPPVSDTQTGVLTGEQISTPGPVVITGQEQSDAAPLRAAVELFTLDGKTYTMPADLRPAVVLRFFGDVRKHGYEQAWAVLMSSSLPEDAMNALAESPKVQPEHIAQVMSIVTDTAISSIKRYREAAGEQ